MESKLYFESEELAMAYSSAEAEYEWDNPLRQTEFKYAWDKDEIGWYCVVDQPNE